MTKLKLPSGVTYGYDGQGNRICTGTKMGRRDVLPDDRGVAVKLRMERLHWVDGDYDQAGAYWGGGPSLAGNYIYCAWGEHDSCDNVIYVFVRASYRDDAKAEVRALLPNARFYN